MYVLYMYKYFLHPSIAILHTSPSIRILHTSRPIPILHTPIPFPCSNAPCVCMTFTPYNAPLFPLEADVQLLPLQVFHVTLHNVLVAVLKQMVSANVEL